ncbi:hypothetical protein OAM69_04840, partial [bacterium]|nr:hypothetical protein [bacterium]
RIKEKNDFWKNPDWSKEHEKYQNLTRNLESVFSDIYSVEEKALASFRNHQEKLKPEVLQDEIDVCRLGLEGLLVKLNYEIHPEHNNAVLSFYGPDHALADIDNLMRDWLKFLELKYTMLYHYFLTPTDSMPTSKQSDTDSMAKIETKNRGKTIDTARVKGNGSTYSTVAGLVNNSNHVLIGKAYVLHAPSVTLYFTNEPGVWQISSHSIVSLIYADLHMGDKKDLTVPENVHRKQFYNGKKPDRKISNGTYSDKRISEKDSCELHNHAQEMQKTRKAVLYSTHLGVHSEINGKSSK